MYSLAAQSDKPLMAEAVREFHVDPRSKQGSALLGSGCYGNVWEYAGLSDVVIKDYDPTDGYSVWAMYAAAAYRRGNGNAILPRIFAMSMPEDHTEPGARAFIMMEKLGMSYSQRSCDWNDPVVAKYNTIKESVVHFTTPVFYNQEQGCVVVAHGVQPVRGAEHYVKHITTMMAMAIAENVKLGNDMHGGNWMYRGDTLVLTDPVTGGYEEGPSAQAALNARIVGLADRLARECAVYQPGFYSRYANKRMYSII